MQATSLPHDSDELRWQAVQRRDPAADGHFFYAVLSTGVYCRPSCASRPARRDNLRFFVSPETAEQAGYRPCKRCHPRDASAQTRQRLKVAELCRVMEQTEQVPTLQQLADLAGLSPHYLHRLFKRTLGITPKAYANALRQRRLAANLDRQHTVTQAACAAGFSSGSRLHASAQAMLGMTPSAYRSGGNNQQIRYALAPCSLGLVLAAFSSRGACAILLGDDAETLQADLGRRFPKARCLHAAEELNALMLQIVELVENPSVTLDIPLDIRGTAFQQRVWQTLRQIPPGHTASYAEIAAGMDQPKAVRAVAGACAANPLALAVPCHRVLRSDGSLSGYRWGLERKQTLLQREAAHNNRQE
ncbi:MAG: bifunctional DNA-binding transcriptional regulator/O6-methylguanine-DNA methyltransferase Ada [Halopseudomonas sp.]|uniref:bifunctional DNA-binding transcriptional regulator/O6-methylguanine-DNA methyltransferase Ada n=1 Tax=Halopseudomonas sp. TaxID=2901191 RepID=UPI0030039FE5